MPDVKALANKSRLIGLSLGRAVAKGDLAQIKNWALKQAQVSTAIAVALDPSLAEPETEDEPLVWSEDEAVARIQGLTEAGVEIRTTPRGGIVVDSAELLRDTADKPAIREALTILGMFGQAGSVEGVDYTAWSRYYVVGPDGNAAPRPEYAGVSIWASYLKGA